MGQLTATGSKTIISGGFVARGDTNQSDGRGPSYEIGRYDTIAEAIQAARGKGVQGDPGTVSLFSVVLYEGGLVRTEETPLIERRRTPEGNYSVGFVDLREFEYGVRLAGTTAVRPSDNSIFGLKSFAVEGAEAAAIELMAPGELRERLLNEPTVWVGLWRRKGDGNWRGEFVGNTDQILDRWLP